jgi:DNA polymerase-2
MEYTGWLFDVYAAPQNGVVLWLLGEDGARHCLHQPFPITFYIGGPAARLRALWRFLKDQPVEMKLSREERRDLFLPDPVPVLAIQVERAADQERLFRRAVDRFPDLNYYDADVPLALRYAAAHAVFPLARCRLAAGPDGRVEEVAALDTRWDLEPPPPPLRTLALEPDSDPAHARPEHLLARFERYAYRLSLEPQRSLLVGLRAILQRHDPDLLLTSWGDTWLLPYLLEAARQARLPLPFNRDPSREALIRPEHTYFSYGQVIYMGQQVHLFGRWHIDRYNAILFMDYGLEGALEMARVTALPTQTAARVSPGTGISSMQMVTALCQGVLIPWHKQQAERPKSALDLLRADQGGLVYQPTTGLHYDVGEIDFVSMYPSIMVHFNISPETVGTSQAISQAAPELGPPGDPEQPPGLVPQTLAPLLGKRLALKSRLAVMPDWHPHYKLCKARASAHKWLLVTCFGYLGYKNARFGRIEAHEAVTAYGREALLRAKEAAEDQGYTVLHLYVDGLWVCKPGASRVADFQPLLDEILERTRLPVALDGIFRWVAFLPSRQDQRVPVANRYFGVFQDGSMKLRGIEVRRRDTPHFIGETQLEILVQLVQARPGDPHSVPLPRILGLLRRRLSALRSGKVPLEALLVTQKLSRVLDEFRTRSPVARAVAQLAAAGVETSPGERVRFLYTRGEPGVHAWNLPYAPNPACLDTGRYAELLVRAAGTVLGPFGVSEALLRQWLFENAAYSAPPGVLPERKTALPLLARPARLSPEPAPAAWAGQLSGDQPLLLDEPVVYSEA